MNPKGSMQLGVGVRRMSGMARSCGERAPVGRAPSRTGPRAGGDSQTI